MSAIMLKKAWKKPAWISGNVFVLYTATGSQHIMSHSLYYMVTGRRLTTRKVDLLWCQGPPLPYVPSRLQADQPEHRYYKYHPTREQW